MIIVTIILLLLIVVSLLFITMENFRFRSISVCIPCIPRDIPKLGKLLKSIDSQSHLPKEVVIALSSSSSKECKILSKKLEPRAYKLLVVGTTDKNNASTNRNRGIEYCSGDIISFMDADDVMHKDRLKLICDQFIMYDCDAVIHTYKTKYKYFKKPLSKNYRTFFYKDINKLAMMSKGKYALGSKYSKFKLKIRRICYGHISCSRKILENIKYDESINYGEDGKFIRDILKYIKSVGEVDTKIVLIDLPLSWYIPSKYQKKRYK